MTSRRASVVLTLLATGLLVACNSAAGSNAPAATAAAATPAGQPSAAATPAGSEGPGASADVGSAAQNLAHLQSYKLTLQTTGSSNTNVETTVVNGATPARSYSQSTGSLTIRIIEIGSDVWVDQGTGTFVKNALPKSAVDSMLMAFDPGVLFAAMQKQPALAFLQNMGTEQKNGVNAIHLHADQNTPLPAGASPIPAGAVFDLWLAADGGYLVAAEGSGLSASKPGSLDTIKMEVTNVNDPTLTVTPPA